MSLKIKRLILFLSLNLLTTLCYSSTGENEEIECGPHKDHCFKKIAITGGRGLTEEEEPRYFYKVIIRKLVDQDDHLKDTVHESEKSITRIAGKTLWTITPDMLPVNEHTCIHGNVDPCEMDPNEVAYNERCYKSCIMDGPEFFAYDEKRNLLYLLAGTVEVGQGGGAYLGFVANLNTKKIKYLRMFPGFSEGELSPTGRYLLLQNDHGGYVDIYDTKTGEEFHVPTPNSWPLEHEVLHRVFFKRWLSDTQFLYRDRVINGDYEPKVYIESDNVYDIPSKKIIDTHILSKSEYQREASTEPSD